MLTATSQKQNQTQLQSKKREPFFFQPKLTINQPNDVYEQEADAVADTVMRMDDVNVAQQTFFKPPVTNVQRKCQHCEEEEKLYRKEANSEATVANSSTENYIRSLDGKGKLLSPDVRSFFEPRMSHDFSNVRVHTDSVAAKSAQSINALAYTSGNHIIFNQNQFSPENESGKKLLAHELTHVVQQNSSAKNVTPFNLSAGAHKSNRQHLSGTSVTVQRQAPGAGMPSSAHPPVFAGCNDGSRRNVQSAIHRAALYIQSAINALNDAPRPNTPYASALATHFLNPTDVQRRTIQHVFRRMLGGLRGNNFTCVSATTPDCIEGAQAFWDPSDDLIHVCPRFFRQSRNQVCMAVILIHELAHDSGIDLTGTHVLDRGTAAYPVAGRGAARGHVSSQGRIFAPDAYAFFAAHVHNGVDTAGDCF